RVKRNLSIVMIDIDFFKKINDKYGHIKADELLKRLANIIKKATRKADVAARFGGEEFVIFLPEIDIDKAERFASRIKKDVDNDKIIKKHKLTISIGVTQFRNSTDTKKKLMQRVDSALFKAKRTGRNKLIVIK
ncbi:MAG: GGDEF domain-containing protein, partial [Nanoarchaeota archaeon]